MSCLNPAKRDRNGTSTPPQTNRRLNHPYLNPVRPASLGAFLFSIR